MYEFWFHYGKPKYWCNVKLCYTDKDNNIMHIKTEDVYKHITNDVEKRFDTSNYYIIIISKWILLHHIYMVKMLQKYTEQNY